MVGDTFSTTILGFFLASATANLQLPNFNFCNRMLYMNRPKILGTSEAAGLLGVARQRLNYLILRDKIPFQRIAAGKVFFEEDIMIYKRQRGMD